MHPNGVRDGLLSKRSVSLMFRYSITWRFVITCVRACACILLNTCIVSDFCLYQPAANITVVRCWGTSDSFGVFQGCRMKKCINSKTYGTSFVRKYILSDLIMYVHVLKAKVTFEHTCSRELFKNTWVYFTRTSWSGWKMDFGSIRSQSPSSYRSRMFYKL